MKTRIPAFMIMLIWDTATKADIILSIGSPTYSQNFDTLAASGTSSVLPDGWATAETGSNANTIYTAGTGSSTTGDTYSFGTDGDRALGGLRSGNLIPLFGFSFSNGGANAINGIAVEFTGEQWRLGETNRAEADSLIFAYSLNATSLTTGTWTDVSLLDFQSPITNSTVGLRNGNAPANRSLISGTLTGLLVNSNESIWFRWSDFNVGGSDDGLAIDDFSVTANFAAVPEPSSFFVIASSGLTAIGVRSLRKTKPSSQSA